MLKKLTAVAVVALAGIAGIAIGQLSYPNADDPAVILDNEHVVVQKYDTQPGDWVGTHKHAGNQLVVILEDSKLLYNVDGEETEKVFKAGDVMWIDAVEHDHKAVTPGAAIIVTVK